MSPVGELTASVIILSLNCGPHQLIVLTVPLSWRNADWDL